MESFYLLAACMLLVLALLPGEVLCQQVWQVIGSAGFKFNPSRDFTWSELQMSIPQSDIKLLSGCAPWAMAP
jgi:hypothetical protein